MLTINPILADLVAGRITVEQAEARLKGEVPLTFRVEHFVRRKKWWSHCYVNCAEGMVATMTIDKKVGPRKVKTLWRTQRHLWWNGPCEIAA